MTPRVATKPTDPAGEAGTDRSPQPGPSSDPYADFGGHVGEFTSQSEPWWPPRPVASVGAPNIVVVLVDDLGFSDLGPFGSEIDTPNIDRLAAEGRVLTNYHTAPMCSPSRASLLTGLNPHRAGFGFVAHIDPGYPGFALELPEDAPTLAESLRAAGYATFMVGKWHLTVESRLHDGADRSSWPLQRGFDRYYGCMDGFTSVHQPHRLVRDNSPVTIEEFPPDYFLTDDLTDQALAMVGELRVNDPDKPFFLYFAHTAVHGPLQAKPDDIAKYRGRYDDGWDARRKARFQRQQQLGIVGLEATLSEAKTDGPKGVPAWESLNEDERALFARHMEVYAAAVDEVDQSVGRLLTRLDEIGERENTIVVLASDNGGTAEGGQSGTRSYFAQFGIGQSLPNDWVRDVPRPLDLLGGPQVWGHYPVGWAHVSNTPFRSFKSSTYEGGVHAPLVVSWPAGLGTDVTPRRQFAFVSDLAPTILELVGVTPLASRGGRPSLKPDGVSFAGALQDARADESRTEQYFECLGSRAMYADGIKAVSPVPPTTADGAAGGVWELYDLRADPTETCDLAESRPEETAGLAHQWRELAWTNRVFPLDDDGTLHTVRPASEANLSRPVDLPALGPPLERFRSSRLTVLRSFDVVAHLDLEARACGVVVAHGDQGGGYLFALEEGRPYLAYNAYGAMHRATGAMLEAGPHTLELRVVECPGLRWELELFADGRVVGHLGPVPMLLGMAPFTGISVGYDYGSPVDWDLHTRRGANKLSRARLVTVRYEPGPRSEHDPIVLRAIAEAVARVGD